MIGEEKLKCRVCGGYIQDGICTICGAEYQSRKVDQAKNDNHLVIQLPSEPGSESRQGAEPEPNPKPLENRGKHASDLTEASGPESAPVRSAKGSKRLPFVLLAGIVILIFLAGIFVTVNRKYTVVFDLNGGQLVSGELEQTVKRGESAIPPVAVRGSRELTWNGEFQHVKKDTTVTAEWTRKEQLSRELREYAAERTVTINSGQFQYSGAVIGEDGLIATIFYQLMGSGDLSVQTEDGTKYDAVKIIDFDQVKGTALLKIDADALPFFELSETPGQIDESVCAFGLRRRMEEGRIINNQASYGAGESYDLSIRVDQELYGGALVNRYGELLGIVADTAADYENLAIKSEEFLILTDQKDWIKSDFERWVTNERQKSLLSIWFYDSENNGNSEKRYVPTMIHNYWEITQDRCIASIDVSDQVINGYRALCPTYSHVYTAAGFQNYRNYLLNSGFQYLGSYVSNDETFHVFWNNMFAFNAQLGVDAQRSRVIISCIQGYEYRDAFKVMIAG